VDIIAPLISAFFQLLMTLLMTAIQIISWPLNQLIVLAFPDISGSISTIQDNLINYIGFIPWVLTFLPPGVPAVLIGMLGVELLMLTVFRSSYFASKLWRIVQRIKFW